MIFSWSVNIPKIPWINLSWGTKVSPSNLGTATFQPWGLSLTRLKRRVGSHDKLTKNRGICSKENPSNDGTEQKKKTHTSDVWSKYVLLIFGKHVPFKDDKRWRCYQNFFELTVSPKVVVCFRGPSQLARTPHRWSFPTPPFVFRFVGPLACGELWGWASEESFTANSLSETNSGFCEKPLKNGSFMKP